MTEKHTLSLNDIYEATLAQLDRSTEKGFPDTSRQKGSATVRITQTKFDFIKDGETVGLLATGRSTGSKENNYKCNILFLDIKTDETKIPDNVELIVDNETYYIKKINKTNLDVKVACTCMDFRFRFAEQNFKDGSLYGEKPDPYVRKTETRPPANPTDAIGMCKHLYALQDELESQGLIS